MLNKLSAFLMLLALSSCSSYKLAQPELAIRPPATTVTLKRVDNLRSVSGMVNGQGRSLKDSLIYRSANLHKLKSSRFNDFKNLGITKIIDLRTKGEIDKQPDNVPPGVTYVNLAAFEDKGDEFNRGRKLVLKGEIDRAAAEKRMLDFYRGYVTEKPETIKEIIRQILDNNGAVLYHCTAGKDRTGIVTALVLKVLKFDDSVIFNDYLYSNNQREDLVYKRLNLAKKAHVVYPKMEVAVLEKLSWIETSYLKATFDEINLKYGSMDNYIHNVLGISEQQRKYYIEKFTR
nr:tyrosine-protein phosphatase [uncultured Flavobacterium sp.]